MSLSLLYSLESEPLTSIASGMRERSTLPSSSCAIHIRNDSVEPLTISATLLSLSSDVSRISLWNPVALTATSLNNIPLSLFLVSIGTSMILRGGSSYPSISKPISCGLLSITAQPLTKSQKACSACPLSLQDAVSPPS